MLTRYEDYKVQYDKFKKNELEIPEREVSFIVDQLSVDLAKPLPQQCRVELDVSDTIEEVPHIRSLVVKYHEISNPPEFRMAIEKQGYYATSISIYHCGNPDKITFRCTLNAPRKQR